MAVPSNNLSELKKAMIVERARKELPELDRRYEKAIGNLQRISSGQRPAA
ncbi:MAG TPA: hypothetical protein VKB23_11225 [Solirubrobacterales bacterium]|nr:hypothetical protein [Solirubrobacterales bacterium]